MDSTGATAFRFQCDTRNSILKMSIDSCFLSTYNACHPLSSSILICVIQRVLYLTFNFRERKSTNTQKTKLLSFLFVNTVNCISALQSCSRQDLESLRVVERDEREWRASVWQKMTTKYYLTGGTCHFDVGEGVKGIYAELAEKQREGMERSLIFVQCFSF